MSEIPIRIPAVKREHTSIRVDPLIWKPFVRACHAVGDSACGVLEPYMYGFTEAVKRGVPVQAANITLNLTVNRITERSRRRLPRGKEDKMVVDVGSPENCSFCNNVSRYRTTRWPSLELCLREYVCEVCKWRLSHMVGTLGMAELTQI